MKKIIIIIAILVVAFLTIFLLIKDNVSSIITDKAGEVEVKLNNKKSNMKITSTAFNTGEKIPSVYTCDGKDTNPTLVFSDVSESAKSLVLIMDDPDAPAGTFVHWVVYNIDPQTEKVVENSVPESGIQGATSAGDSKYHGPCPPSGTHRYFFKLYALDIVLSVPENTNKRSLIDAMNGHVIANAELIGLYGRSQ